MEKIELHNIDLNCDGWNIDLNQNIIKNINLWIKYNNDRIKYHSEKRGTNYLEKISMSNTYIKYWESLKNVDALKSRINELEIEVNNGLKGFGEVYYDLFPQPLPDEYLEYMRLISLRLNNDKIKSKFSPWVFVSF